MLHIERMEDIIAELREKKTVRVSELAGMFFISESTARRYLAELERAGVVHRTYGGAVLINNPNSESGFQMRTQELVPEKDKIAQAASRLVRDGQFIMLDSTTTASRMVRYLGGYANLRVITTSAETALACLDTLNDAQVICTGGTMHAFSRGCYGDIACASIAMYRPDLLFFSARGADIGAGITDVNGEVAQLKRTMLKSARCRVLLADFSKLDKISYCVVDALEAVDCLITDRQPPPAWERALEKAGVRLLYPGLREKHPKTR